MSLEVRTFELVPKGLLTASPRGAVMPGGLLPGPQLGVDLDPGAQRSP